jgi:hypothetical protein
LNVSSTHFNKECLRITARISGAQANRTAHDHLLVVDARQLGEIAGLGDDELGNPGRFGPTDQLPPLVQHGPQQVRRAVLVLGQQLLAEGDMRDEHLADHRLEQRFLAVEVEVDRPLGDPGAAGPHASGVVSAWGATDTAGLRSRG